MSENELTLLSLDLRRGGEQARRPPEALMLALGAAIRDDAVRNLREGTTPDGGAALPLAHSRPSGRGGPPRVDSGKMLNLLQHGGITTNLVGGNEVVTVASAPGAATHQWGALISPRRGAWLTVPLTAEGAANRARSFPGRLFALIRPGKASGVLAERVGPRGQIKAHYALVKSVFVPARPFIGVSQRLLAKLDEIAVSFFGRSLFGGGR